MAWPRSEHSTLQIQVQTVTAAPIRSVVPILNKDSTSHLPGNECRNGRQ
jgi:hypothetical protein